MAENHDSAHAFALEPGRPLRCMIVDAGGRITGDPVGGDSPLDPVRVAAALSEALKGSYAFSDAADRDLDIIYHWGLIRPIRAGLPPTSQLDPNFKARLLLVDRPERVADIEDALVHQYVAGAALSSVIESQMWAETIGRADDSRYYVIVSAYDHAAMARGEAKLVWRTRLSTPEKSGPMNDVLVTLAGSSRDFLGADRRSPKTYRMPLASTSTATSTEARHPFMLTQAQMAELEKSILVTVVQSERAAFAGQ